MSTIEVRSEISGCVWKVEVTPGADLQEYDVIVILESMKMEIPIVSPKAGKLVEVLVKEGDAVSDDDLIARIEI
ncbi:MAG: acetyl-CoA carboxylase biotin carboxyl carrier protein subunit [Ahrensia sp.]|nr:acetyl-CoA carboxylase biotin carboxyl carrier protein subunit [Ahrensia sp.]